MKLLRTIRLDPSDTFVFDKAAEPGEWAVPGAFAFLDADPPALQGKAMFRMELPDIPDIPHAGHPEESGRIPQDRCTLRASCHQRLRCAGP